MKFDEKSQQWGFETEEEAMDWVHDAICDISPILYDRTNGLHDRQRWLAIGRVINFLWAHHFRPVISQTMKTAEESLKCPNT